MYQTTKEGSEELEGSVEGSKWRIHRWRGGVRKEQGELKKRKGTVNTTRSRSVLGGKLSLRSLWLSSNPSPVFLAILRKSSRPHFFAVAKQAVGAKTFLESLACPCMSAHLWGLKLTGRQGPQPQQTQERTYAALYFAKCLIRLCISHHLSIFCHLIAICHLLLILLLKSFSVQSLWFWRQGLLSYLLLRSDGASSQPEGNKIPSY